MLFLDSSTILGTIWRLENFWLSHTGLFKVSFGTGVITVARVSVKRKRMTCFTIHTAALYNAEVMSDGSKFDRAHY